MDRVAWRVKRKDYTVLSYVMYNEGKQFSYIPYSPPNIWLSFLLLFFFHYCLWNESSLPLQISFNSLVSLKVVGVMVTKNHRIMVLEVR